MAVLSGIGAVVQAGASVESTVGRWAVRHRGLIRPYAATNTQGAFDRNSGNVDWLGYYYGYGHTPLVFPGDSFAFTGSLDGTNGVTGTARCQQLMLNAPVESGREITYRVDFRANGALTRGAAAISDTSSQTKFSAIGLPVSLDYAEFSQTRFWRLLFRSALRPYVHHGTSGQVQCNAGNLDVQWLFGCYYSDPTALPAVNATPMLRFYVTATTYWQVAWGKVEDVDSYSANVEGAENLGATISGGFRSYSGTGAGNIINPAGLAKWP